MIASIKGTAQNDNISFIRNLVPGLFNEASHYLAQAVSQSHMIFVLSCPTATEMMFFPRA